MLDFFGSLGSFIMTPLYWLISGILLGWHQLWSLVFAPDSGIAWALSIIGLTLVIRALLIPLFVKQIRSSRNLQLLQPKVKELQEKYKHDRQKFAEEQMKLYKETGTNPFASCLPLIIQMPIFIALFRLLDRAANGETRGLLTNENVDQLSQAKIFGARIADTFSTDGTTWHVQALAGFLVVAMTATTFITQKQLFAKNMPPEALKGPMAQQQKIFLYVLPLVFAVGGVAFPIGVLLYWTTSNLWTMGQQFVVIRNSPAPNTEAWKAKQARDAAKAAKKGLPAPGTEAEPDPSEAVEPRRPAQRQQPKKQSRSQRRTQGQPRPQTQGDDA